MHAPGVACLLTKSWSLFQLVYAVQVGLIERARVEPTKCSLLFVPQLISQTVYDPIARMLLSTLPRLWISLWKLRLLYTSLRTSALLRTSERSRSTNLIPLSANKLCMLGCLKRYSAVLLKKMLTSSLVTPESAATLNLWSNFSTCGFDPTIVLMRLPTS